jgi:DNA-binding NtrC family response regulator
MKSVLIAHSDPDVVRRLEAELIDRGLGVTQISDGQGALEVLEKTPVNAMFTEMDLPRVSGLQLARHAAKAKPEVSVVVLGRDATAAGARKAYNAGAFDYLPAPPSPEDLRDCLARLLAESPVEAEAGGRFPEIIGQSRPILRVLKLVEKVAKTDSTVMIYGESGTGKELIARAIHQHSQRSVNPLIPVNCGAIPEELLESELFGHEKGAFTNAIRMRAGRFEMSDGGTIFLDEIADMSPKLQVKILRVLQEHQFERIGGAKTVNVDIRVITATNKDLRQAMEGGHFREDLFYRLNVIPITVPPLRERKSDIPFLVDHFLGRFRKTRGSGVTNIEQPVMDKLIHYAWPGNIRELENIIERMVILAEGDALTLEDLPPRIADSAKPAAAAPVTITEDGIDFNQVVSDFENQLLLAALEQADWVKNKAAQLLRLNRTTLVEKLKKKNIPPPS